MASGSTQVQNKYTGNSSRHRPQQTSSSTKQINYSNQKTMIKQRVSQSAVMKHAPPRKANSVDPRDRHAAMQAKQSSSVMYPGKPQHTETDRGWAGNTGDSHIQNKKSSTQQMRNHDFTKDSHKSNATKYSNQRPSSSGHIVQTNAARSSSTSYPV